MRKLDFFALTASTLAAVSVLVGLANVWVEMPFMGGRHLATIAMVTSAFAAVNEGTRALAYRVVNR